MARPRARHRGDRRRTQARRRVGSRRRAARRSLAARLRRRRIRRIVRCRGRADRRRRRAHGRDPRRRPASARKEERSAAGGEPAQDAAGDGRGHPRRADQARRAHPGAALSGRQPKRCRRSRARTAPARPSICSRRSPTASASGSSSGSSRTLPCARSSRRPTSASRSLLDERRLDRQHYIESVQATLRRELAAAGIKAEVSGRAKHIYSIWTKMRAQAGGHRVALRHPRRAHSRRRRSRTATPRSASCTTCGRRCRASSTITSPSPRRTTTGRCTPRSSGRRGSRSKCRSAPSTCTGNREYGVAAHWRYKEGAHDRPSRSRLRGEDRLAAPGARLEGRRRRRGRVAAAVQVEPVHRDRSTCSRRRAG